LYCLSTCFIVFNCFYSFSFVCIRFRSFVVCFFMFFQMLF
jgi:hypothetical protein